MTSSFRSIHGESSMVCRAVAHSSVPKVGERVNGDGIIWRHASDGRLLLGVVDALGHGPGALEVAEKAIAQLTTASLDLPMKDLMELVHQCLQGTRGAAATLCLIGSDRLQACGVGNVEFRCSEIQIPFVFSPGILGVRVQRFRVCESRLLAGARLVLFSDGISSLVRIDDFRGLSPQDACNKIVERHRRPEDDSTVLIADFR